MAELVMLAIMVTVTAVVIRSITAHVTGRPSRFKLGVFGLILLVGTSLGVLRIIFMNTTPTHLVVIALPTAHEPARHPVTVSGQAPVSSTSSTQ
jgi:hypothetical protein